MLFSALVLLLMLITACVAAPTSPRVNISDPEISKRWYSVPEGQGIPGQRWTAWPRSNDGSCPIHYCFEDAYTHNMMDAIFKRALAKWAPAFRLSALRFVADPACQQEPCICSQPHVSETTLHIMIKEESTWIQGTLGYRLESRDPNLPRHFLQYSSKPFFYEADGHLMLAHELGEYFDGQLWRTIASR